MDLRKAFDSVPRSLLFKKLRHIGVRGRICNAIQDLYTKNKARVIILDYLSDYFEIHSGVMQGSKRGPILFIFYINDLLLELEAANLGVSIGNVAVSALGLADDIVLIADNPKNLQKLINICVNWASRNGITFNTDKCKTMTLNTRAKNQHF